MIVKTKKLATELKQVRDATHYSLKSLRKDILHVYEWINYLAGQDNSQRELCEHLKKHVASLSVTHDSFRGRMDLLAEFSKRLHDIDMRLVELEKGHKDVMHHIKKAAAKVAKEEPLAEKVSKLEARIEPKLVIVEPAKGPPSDLDTKRLREKILGYLKRHGPVPSTDLRAFIVTKNNLASQSGFYRVLKSMIKQGLVDFHTEGRERILRAATHL